MSDVMQQADFLPLVEATIWDASGETGNWVTHEALVARLLNVPDALALFSARSKVGGGEPTVGWLAANAVARLGHLWTVGSRIPEGLSRQQHRGAWAYRRDVGPPPPLPGTPHFARRLPEAYSERIDEALRVAAAAHVGQDRKGTSIPYVMHPVHVGRLLEIFLSRMTMMRQACEFLGCKFHLIINDTRFT